ARSGLYNSKTELLTLTDDIVVTSTNGDRALLSEAVIDPKAGKIISQKPVQVTSGSWTINANRMEIAESGDVMRFERGVTVVLAPESADPAMPSSAGRR